jgi:hypothetical protein
MKWVGFGFKNEEISLLGIVETDGKGQAEIEFGMWRGVIGFVIPLECAEKLCEDLKSCLGK